MHDVNELQLDTLSVSELRTLKENIDTAIRAAIRERNQAKQRPMTPVQPAPNKFDLERERDAWIAAKRQGSTLGK
jgi:hypothetical protein